MHVLDQVSDPEHRPPGALRLATPAEVDLLGAWEKAFSIEAGVGTGEEAMRAVEARIERDAQFVWEDEHPRSMLALSPAIAETVRIGPVYTPPEHRRRGYASSAVACAARGALADGARRCMLFTDLANPTSNKIYASIGFRRLPHRRSGRGPRRSDLALRFWRPSRRPIWPVFTGRCRSRDRCRDRTPVRLHRRVAPHQESLEGPPFEQYPDRCV